MPPFPISGALFRLFLAPPKELATELSISDGAAKKRLHDYLTRGLLEQPHSRGKYFVAKRGNHGNVGIHEQAGDALIETEGYEGYEGYPLLPKESCSRCGGELRPLPAGGYKCDGCGEIAAWPEERTG